MVVCAHIQIVNIQDNFNWLGTHVISYFNNYRILLEIKDFKFEYRDLQLIIKNLVR